MNKAQWAADLNEQNDHDEVPAHKLHLMTCVLMTKFHYHQCPKMAQFIVRQLRLLLEKPEIREDPSSHALYLQLLNQWQNIALMLIEKHRQVPLSGKMLH